MMKNKVFTTRLFITILPLLAVLLLPACSLMDSILKEGKAVKPEVSFDSARIDRLSFTGADLLFDLKIENPNPVGVRLSGLDYNLFIDNSSFLSGNQDEKIEIQARGESTVQLPITLEYRQVYKALRHLMDKNESTYRLDCGFHFNVPVLGDVRVPVSKEGQVPMIKLPRINLKDIKITRLGLSKADLRMKLGVENPNSFSMIINSMTYQLLVQNRQWAGGEAGKNVQVGENAEDSIDLDFSLDFVEIGRSVYTMITSGEDFDYQLKGNFDAATSDPLLGRVNVPFEESGTFNVIR
jgi:LEA14-like dessication related protein